MARKSIEELIFVYDADSGPIALLKDGARKLFAVKGCALCDITHGILGEKATWKSCRDTLGVPVSYVHRDELSGAVAAVSATSLPCVLARVEGDEYVLLVARDVLKRCRGDALDLVSRLYIHSLSKGLDLPELRAGVAAVR